MNHIENYKTWLNEETLSIKEKEILKSMDEKEIEEAFFQNLSFGTGGLRGIMGLGTNRVNIYTIRKSTYGLGQYLIKNNFLNGVAIAYDNRIDSKLFAYESAKVLAALGIKSFVYKNLRPTPMLSFAVRYFKASAGIMITASHNPKIYNGYKVYNHTGAQLNLLEADQVISEINNIQKIFTIKGIDSELITWIDEDLDDIYLEKVKEISLNKGKKTITIVYSPLHGTGGTVIPKLLKGQGYAIYPYERQMIVDGNFPNTKSSNPEEKIAYEETISYAKEINADIIMLTDPDADRLGIVVKHDNDYHYLNGNQTASIELFYILESLKQQNKLPKEGYVFSTIVSTNLLKEISQAYNMNFIETLTGFKFIGEQAEMLNNNQTYLFGCEESYGSLINDFVRDKDAVQAVYLLAEIADTLKDKGLTIIDFLNQIYEKFGYFLEHTENITLSGVEGLNKINEIMDYNRKNHLKFDFLNLVSVEDYEESIRYIGSITESILLPKSNVIKFIYDQGTTVTLRPSGTEPKLKIYYATKQDSMEKSHAFIEKMHKVTLELIKKLGGL